MSIAKNLEKLKSELPKEVSLVAVSKTKPKEDVLEAYNTGQRDFGENKVQELVDKAEELPKDIQWHMIGHLQRNKVKYLVDFVHLIHGVDSEKLLKEIQKRAEKIDRKVNCLLQVHIAEESSKFGFSEEEILELLRHERFLEYPNVNVQGLMGMATFTDNQDQVGREFQSLSKIYKAYADEFNWSYLSMGMSGDYKIALDKGSNMVRIGSSIFGSRA